MSNWSSMDELRRHLAETGSETEILTGGESEPKTEARKNLEREEREARQRALYGFLLPEIERAGLPEPVREHPFWPDRKWRFDLAWPRYGIAMEIEGGIWLSTGDFGKGHAHPIRFMSDCEKYSHAAIAGWTVIRGTVEQIQSLEVIEWLRMAFQVLSPTHPLSARLAGFTLVQGIADGIKSPGPSVLEKLDFSGLDDEVDE